MNTNKHVRALPFWTGVLLLLLCSLGMSSSAFAQSTSFQVENFEPVSSQGYNTLNINHSRVMPHLTPSGGILFHFADDPIQLVPVGGDVDNGGARLIDNQLKAELLGSIGLFNIVELGIAVPIAVYQSGDAAPQLNLDNGIKGFAISDIRLTPKVQIIDPEASWSKGFGLGLSLPLYLPIGDTESFQSDGTFRVEPRLALDWRHKSGFLIGANLGFQLLRSEETTANFVNGNVFRWGLGVQAPVGVENLKVIGSLFGNVTTADAKTLPGIDDADAQQGNPMEALLGLQMVLPKNLVAQVGGGAGLSSSVGSPDFRVFAGLSYTPMDDDLDDDGIKNNEDKCPTKPEDKDGFEDQDGCPDPDNDQDTVLDGDDKCPDKKEDLDKYKDTDGCPDPDNDNDGIMDKDDKCPMEAEDKDGFEDKDGCPDLDNDKDGIADKEDKCPLKPEDKDGFEDKDGCPDPDNDGDTILDKDDKCPNVAGVPEEQGCPIKDTDKDGIPDKQDKCPTKPETYNGIKDKDGCPDGKVLVKVTETEVKIFQKVFFDTGKASIKKKSFKLLNTVASVLNKYPQITQIRVEGHTDDVGKDSSNLKLSKARAKSVRDYLVNKDVKASRLTSEGFGEDKPLCKDVPELSKTKRLKRKNRRKIKACRSDNRRVEFKVTELNGKKVNASDSVKVK